jgi:RecA-family ATPase
VLFGDNNGKSYFLKDLFESDKNMFFVKKINILYCSLKDSLSTIQNIYFNTNGIHNVDICFEENLNFWKNYDLIVIDKLSYFLQGKYDKSSNKDMSIMYEELVKRAKENNVSILILDETDEYINKKPGCLNISHIKGSVVIPDNSRLVIGVETMSKEKVVRVSVQKANNTSFRKQFSDIKNYF